MPTSLSASAGGGGPSGSSTGSQAASAYFDFTSNNAFSVGGSGKQTQNADATGGGLTASGSGMSSNSLTWIIAGIAGVALIGAAIYYVRNRA